MSRSGARRVPLVGASALIVALLLTGCGSVGPRVGWNGGRMHAVERSCTPPEPLPAGRYELLCNERNHSADGMHQLFVVT